MGAGWLLGGGAGRLVAHGAPVQAGVRRHYSLTLRTAAATPRVFATLADRGGGGDGGDRGGAEVRAGVE